MSSYSDFNYSQNVFTVKLIPETFRHENKNSTQFKWVFCDHVDIRNNRTNNLLHIENRIICHIDKRSRALRDVGRTLIIAFYFIMHYHAIECFLVKQEPVLVCQQ